ncbi:hypothetical protein FF011L_40460 [Roseimaritima multifibrata]|uniref:VWFA domain-containing protein n=1 Tax=Roseimaritima multifibrata TaxID=1930274 RepID=A0A517MK57_9BACT|nr:VWA domain-containing protein [Roseimaritima multifibrata]QDS95253.1 hypothetical protein FF011L_40460 [Roseimaritima multifibrata]
MGLRRVMQLVAVSALLANTSLTAADPVAGSNRLATYATPAGDNYFALSVQPSADPALLQAARSRPARVVVVVDTSASQVGTYRGAASLAVQSLLEQLRPTDEVKIYAVDVNAAPLSDSFASGTAETTREAVSKLQRRLPLGNTNLSTALHSARAELVGQPGTHSIVYIGDGSSLGEIRDQQSFVTLIDALRADKISIHSLAVGPTTNVELLATLANQTGGVTLAPTEENLNLAGTFGRQLADASVTAPMWIDDLKLPTGMKTVQAGRLPPVRIDRDTVLIGQMEPKVEGNIVVDGHVGGVPFEVAMDATAEPANPDFAFLPGLVGNSANNQGLLLPTPGSWALQSIAKAMNFRADQMVQAGTLALKQGNARGASVVADLALASDPNNANAQMISRLASDQGRLTSMLQESANSPKLQGDEVQEQPSGLLEETDAQRQKNSGRLRAEVLGGLSAARRQMERDPSQVTESLKVLRAIVESEPNIDPDVREELLGDVNSALQTASARTKAFMADQETLQQQVAAAEAVERMLADTFRDEARISQLSQQMNAVMREGRYDEAANSLAPDLADLAGTGRVISQHAMENSHIVSTVERHRRYQDLRERGFVDALSLVEKAFIPFVDEPPIVYPEAETWQRLSRRRLERYGSLDLSGDNPIERRIYSALDDEATSGPFLEEPLTQVARTLSEAHDIPIRIDSRALEEDGLSGDMPVTIDIKGTTLRSFMRLMLEDLDLTYMIDDEVLKITTITTAEANLVTKVYPVGDLVVPVISMGGMGGMGGGMGGMGGGMGGMGGGMGGMGGGMGGMGGGMGGMGGGMGGGMFVIPDDISLSGKATSKSVDDSDVLIGPGPIKLTPNDSQTTAEAWQEYFQGLSFETAAEETLHDQRIRSTIRTMNNKASKAASEDDEETAKIHFAEMRDLISAAIASGNVQAWMYEAYALALMGTDGDQTEIERALLSAVDFADTPEDVMNVATHLEAVGSKKAALRLCQDVSRLHPYRQDCYISGLRIARDLDDIDGLTWACAGVLSQAWPKEKESFEREVRLIARATYQTLQERGEYDAAAEFAKKLEVATAHDVIIRVTWTGDADVDLAVQEPAGTVCSLQNPQTAAGGVLLGDTLPGTTDDGNVTETYVCSKGFSGIYQLSVRRVWGDVSTGNATVSILTDVGRPTQRLIQQQIDLKEKNALLTFEVKDGRREERIAEAQLADIGAAKDKMGGAMLAQLAGGSSLSSAGDMIRDIRRFGGNVGGRQPFGRGGAVGFEPEIEVLPEGASMTAIAIISADRRYVRITPTPTFSQIGNVSTFNFVSGDSENLPDTGGGGGFGGSGVGQGQGNVGF